MQKFRRADAVVEAVQITDSAFDAPHPNEEHVVGLIYEPVQRMVFIERIAGTFAGHVGDWIVKGPDEELSFCKPQPFAATYHAMKNDGDDQA